MAATLRGGCYLFAVVLANLQQKSGHLGPQEF
jgi:hypothetical protein